MKRLLVLSVIVLGISSVMVQLVVMREFLAIFGGNELTYGVILGNWTLLTGIGSYLGKRLPQKHIVLMGSQWGVGILPVIQLFFLRFTRNILFVPGEIANLTEIFVWSFVLLAPFCLLTGSFLIFACTLYSKERNPKNIGDIYIIDSLGDIMGGFLFSFVLIYVLNQVQIVSVILFANVILSLFNSFSAKSKLFYVGLGILLASVGLLFYDINEVTIQQVYRGQHIVYEKNSLYGHIVVTEDEGLITVFENSIPLFSTEDVISTEETVHYAMVQTDEKDLTVLLIGGGASGTVQEVLKYPVQRVDYVEIDPDLIRITRTYTDNLTGAHVYLVDGRKYIKETRTYYDVIIQDVPDPDSAQLNRFYTIEFFKEVKNVMTEKGIFSLSLHASANYLGKPQRVLNSSMYKSLKTVFSHVMIIPGNKVYFLASDEELTYAIAERIEEMDIPTEYVNKYYLSGTLTEDRIQMVLESVTEDVSVNTDFNPEAYYYYLSFWMSQFRTHFGGFLLILITLVILFMVRIAPHPIPFAVFTTGFAGTALEVVLILGFQILYGYVYSWVGILITCFLLGLLLGASYINRALENYSRRSLITLEFFIVIFSVAIGVFLPSMIKVTFLLSTIILGLLVGSLFPLASMCYFTDVPATAASLYSADLLGGCLGALLVSTLLIPLLGVGSVCILVGSLNAASGLLLLKRR
ncbi:MAG: fused MFS/spermidine synthase [Theionarchaea archaeon]|nr:fused MFS/spermidine synthase [Theionarchaea archaeon]